MTSIVLERFYVHTSKKISFELSKIKKINGSVFINSTRSSKTYLN